MKHRFALMSGIISLVWGAASGWWPVAIFMALGLELPLLLRRRLYVSDKDFILFSKLLMLIMCLLFLGLLIDEPRDGLPNFITWMPALLSLLVMIQVWSEQGTYPLRAIVISLVRSADYTGTAWPRAVDLRMLFFLLTLVSVSMNLPEQGPWFVLFAVLIAWLIWRNHPGRRRPGLWLAMALAATALSQTMVVGIDSMHRRIQQHSAECISEYWARINARQTHTAIGNIGRLKLSGRIVYRVAAEPGHKRLLMRAAFSSYNDGTWSVDDHRFRILQQESDSGVWLLQDDAAKSGEEMEVSQQLRRGAGMLILPAGAYRLRISGDAEVEANSYGATRVQYDQDRINYRIMFHDAFATSKPPGVLDRLIPDEYNDVILETAQQLGLAELPPEQVVTRLQAFFRDNFSYSLEQRAPERGQSFLDAFLRQRREGHCEYFATSTTLLLRAAGIPSRYVVGYSMDEYDDTLDRYVIRERHGHAWTQAWINGSWQTLDTTPAGWQIADAMHERWWQGLYDVFGNIRYLVARWWDQDDKGLAFNITALLVALVLIIYLLRRLQGGGISLRWNRAGDNAGQSAANDELQFREVLRCLEQRFGRRPPARPVRTWISTLPLDGDGGQIEILTTEFYRLRYGEQADAERVAGFRRQVQAWLAGPGKALLTAPADPPV